MAIRFMDGFDQETPAATNGWTLAHNGAKLELVVSPDTDNMLSVKTLPPTQQGQKNYLNLRRDVDAGWGDRFCIGFLLRPTRGGSIQFAQIDTRPTKGAQGLITFGYEFVGGQGFCTLNGELTGVPMEYGNVFHFLELELDKVALVARAWLNNELVGTVPITGQEADLAYWIGYQNVDVQGGEAQAIFINDFYESDGTTDFNNQRIGKVKVVTRSPQADAVTEFLRTKGDSNASQVADPANPDGDTSYVYSNMAGAVDLYTNNDPLPFPDAPILAVAVSVAGRKEGPEARAVAPMIQVDGADEIGARVNLRVAAYERGTTIFNVNPKTGGAWDTQSAAGARFGQTLVL
jgi:hypothetical protein